MDEEAVVVKKSHKKLITVIITLTVIIITLLAVAGIFLYKATKPLNEGRFQTAATESVKEGFMRAMLIGGKTEFTNESFNAMMTYASDKKRERAIKKGKSDKVTLTEFEFNADGPSKLYARAFKGPFTFDVQADMDIRLDKEQKLVIFEVLNAKMGDISIKPETVMKFYKKSLEEEKDSTAEFVTVTDTAVTFPSAYSYNLLGNELNFSFDELTVEDGKLVIHAESPFGDWGDIVYSFMFGDSEEKTE